MTTVLFLPGEFSEASSVIDSLSARPEFTVLTADDPAAVPQIIAEQSDIACFICSDVLPDTDPIGVMDSLRDAYPALPIVLYAESGSESLAAEAINHDVTAYLPYHPPPDTTDRLAEFIEFAIEKGSTEAMLRERVKEYRGIRRISLLLEESVDRPQVELMQAIIAGIPPAFQYPADTVVRLTVGDTDVSTSDFESCLDTFAAHTMTANGDSIELEIGYTTTKPPADEGPFLDEELSLCNTIIRLLKGGFERRQYLEELSRREALFREVAENVEEVLWVSDPSNEEMYYVNPEYEHVWGLSRESLYADPGSFIDAIHPADRESVTDALSSVATEGYAEEYRIIQPDGTVRWIYDRGVPVVDETGTVYRIVGIAQDITERKLQSQQLTILNRVLRHNIRNELNVVLGNAELIADEGSDTISAYANRITDSATQLHGLAEKHRRLADRVTAPATNASVALVDQLHPSITKIREQFVDASVTATIPEQSEAHTIGQVEFIVYELLHNAITHSDVDHPVVDLETTITSDTVILSVTDNGPGIPPGEIEILGDIEEPLNHASGITLWLIHWIVTNAGGTMDYESNDPRGSTMTVRLPRLDAVAPDDGPGNT